MRCVSAPGGQRERCPPADRHQTAWPRLPQHRQIASPEIALVEERAAGRGPRPRLHHRDPRYRLRRAGTVVVSTRAL